MAATRSSSIPAGRSETIGRPSNDTTAAAWISGAFVRRSVRTLSNRPARLAGSAEFGRASLIAHHSSTGPGRLVLGPRRKAIGGRDELLNLRSALSTQQIPRGAPPIAAGG